jgi:preprotein translocase subunit YajC
MTTTFAMWTALAQAGGSSGDASPFGGGLAGILPILLMFVVIYLLLIRPASKQRKEHQTLLTALKKDDEIVTSGGIYGRIVGIEDKIVTLEIADRVKVRILRDRIAGRWPSQTETTAKKP